MSGRSPFEDVNLLVIDGNNLLHRTVGGLAPAAARVLIPRLRAVLPAGVRVSIVLDGMPDPGAPIREHIGEVEIRHAGRRTADDAIVEAVEARGYVDRPRTIVVTDDRGLAERIRRLGALHRRIAWLQDALELAHRGPRGTNPTAAAIGRAGVRPPRPGPASAGRAPGADAGDPAEDERTPWTPGRGATKKRGNPHRGSTRKRNDPPRRDGGRRGSPPR